MNQSEERTTNQIARNAMNVNANQDSIIPCEGACVVTNFGTGFIRVASVYVSHIKLDSGADIILRHSEYRVIE